MFFEKEYTPRPDDFNERKNMSLEALLRILEHHCEFHSDFVNDGIENNGIAWILTEWNIDIRRRPKMGDTLRIKTWAHGKTPASIVGRDFVVSDGDGKEIIFVSSRFALLDIAKQKLVRVTPEIIGMYQPEEAKAISPDPKRLRDLAKEAPAQPVYIRRSDIDYNGHVHNTRFIDYALEVMPKEAYERDDFSGFRILYKNQLLNDGTTNIRYVRHENAYDFSLYSGDKLCALMQITQRTETI